MKSRRRVRQLLHLLIAALVLIPSISSYADTTRYTYDEANRKVRVETGGGTAVITATSTAGGSISPPGIIGVRYTDSQRFDIYPDPNYHISDVKVDNVSQGAITTYTFSNLGGNHTIHAIFAIDTYTLNASRNLTAGGTVTSSPAGINCGSDCTETYNYNTTVTLTATPATGYDFIGWSGACTGTGTCVVKMNTNQSATANFSKKTYVITASVDDDSKGIIAPYGNVSVDHGSSPIFSIIPRSGYNITDVKVDNTSIGTPTSYTFSNVTSNRSIWATFSCPILPVRIPRATPVYFSTLQAAYDAAADGETIQSHGIRLTGDLTANRAISVTVDGGYYCDYATRSGDTTVRGMIQTLAGGGTLTLKNLIVGYTVPVAVSTVANPPGGAYNTAQMVTLACSGSCDKIYYTTDGSTPTTASAVYAGPISISSNTILKFFATDTAGKREVVRREFYVFDSAPSTGTVTISSGAAATRSVSTTLSITCNETGGCAKVMYGMVGDKGTDFAVFRGNGNWYLDLDGNNVLEACTVDGCSNFGLSGDIPVTGDWNGDGIADVGSFRNGTWFLDLNGNRAWDQGIDGSYTFGLSGDIPVTGDWNGDGITDIGTFRPSANLWYLDLNGNRAWTAGVDGTISFGLSTDKPVTGDWNGDGITDIGTFRPSTASWYLDKNGNRTWDPANGDTVSAFGLSTDVPVTGDWNGDGKTKIGTFRNGAWNLDMNGNGAWNPTYETDRSFTYGATGDIPVTGNWVLNSKTVLNWTAAQPFAATKTWVLTSGDETKTVYVKFGDAAGNWSDAVNDTILLDTTAPATTPSLPEGTYRTSLDIALKCSDYKGSGCDKIYYTTDGTAPTTGSAQYTGPIALTATTTLKYFAADLAGNQETVQSKVYTIDTSVPVGTVTINSGAAATNAREVTLTLTCSDGASCLQMRFSNDNAVWSAPEAFSTTKAWTLSAGDEMKTVYVRFKNAAGNWTPQFPAIKDTIILETGAPTTTADPAGGIFTSPVSVTLTCADGSSGAGCSKIYYTTDGSAPTTASTFINGTTGMLQPFTQTTTLKFFAVDFASNQEAVKTQYYAINPVRILNTGQTYTSLQMAYNDAMEGYTIQAQATGLTENLSVNQSKSVTLDGGYNNDFTAKTGMTTLKGQVQTSPGGGTLTLKNFIVTQ